MKNRAFILCAGAAAFAFLHVSAASLPVFVTEEDAFESAHAHGHVQGIAISDDAVYCGLIDAVVKFDLATGKLLGHVPAPSHTGDVCWHDGRLYSSVAANAPANQDSLDKHGIVQVFDKDLKLLREKKFPMIFDGITALDGILYLGEGVVFGDPPHRGCKVVRVKESTLELIDVVEIDPGISMHHGIQAMATDGRHLFFSFYPAKGFPGIAVYTKDLKFVKTLPQVFSTGFDLLPSRFREPGSSPVFGVMRSFARKDVNGVKVPGHSCRLECWAWNGSEMSNVTPPQAADLVRRPSRWLNLFNGRDLDGWTPKIRGYKAGENPGSTFRVVDGLLCCRYDDPLYSNGFNERYGHLFYNRPFSNYVLRATYRMPLPQVKGGAGWANYNNGIMLHGQTPESMPVDQPFPVSIEVQLLACAHKGQNRSTANLCTPGTNVERNGKLYTPHGLNSSSATYDPSTWVTVEVEVRSGEKIIHRIDGKTVLEYDRPQYDPNDGTAKKLIKAAGGDLLLRGGTISIQSESAPTDYKSILVRPL